VSNWKGITGYRLQLHTSNTTGLNRGKNIMAGGGGVFPKNQGLKGKFD